MRCNWVLLMSCLAVGCATQQNVTFDNPSPYNISTPRQATAAVVVIDDATLAARVPIRSFMAGAANSWEARPGDMLRQVADIELPQVFSRYERVGLYKEPAQDRRSIVLQLGVPSYEFSDFRARVTVLAVVYEAGRHEIMRKAYTAEGEKQGAKMFWAGAFGMKSAIRQSSLDAYKKVFQELRTDLAALAQAK